MQLCVDKSPGSPGLKAYADSLACAQIKGIEGAVQNLLDKGCEGVLVDSRAAMHVALMQLVRAAHLVWTS